MKGIVALLFSILIKIFSFKMKSQNIWKLKMFIMDRTFIIVLSLDS